MKAVIKRPGSGPAVVDIPNTLKALQEAVGGYIETVTVFADAVIICNEDGRLLSLPTNVRLFGIEFVGTILIVGTDGEEFTDVPNEDAWLDELDKKENMI